MSAKIETTREDFHAKVLSQNVHPHIVGTYPYTFEMTTPTRQVLGVIEKHHPIVDGKENRAEVASRYFIIQN